MGGPADRWSVGTAGTRAVVTVAAPVLALVLVLGLALAPGAAAAAGAAVTIGAAAPRTTAVTSPSPCSATATGDPSSAGGYWLAGADGNVYSCGNAPFEGSMAGQALNGSVVGIAPTPDHAGYWLAAADGGVFAFGDAGFYGSMAGQALEAPVVGLAATPTGNGYWLVAADGGVFAFGDATYLGSMAGKALNAPVVGIAAAPGGGYWLVAADGGVFAFGAGSFGSMGGKTLNAPVVGMSPDPRMGYQLAAQDGGVFTFGPRASFHGSMAGRSLDAPVTGIAKDPAGGYELVARDGGVFALGNAPFAGSLAGSGVDDIVGIADPPSTAVPLSTLVQPDGTRRAVVDVSVAGGPTVPVLLDTGSTGLHLLASAVGTAGLTTVQPETATETYAAQVYRGPVDAAPMTVGGVPSVAPVAFMAITTVSCTVMSPPNCGSPTAKALVADGIYGTMGVSLTPFGRDNLQSPLYSPLLQLPGGTQGYTVGFQTATSGSIDLGSRPAGPKSGVFHLAAATPPAYANGAGAWRVESAAVCWKVGGQGPVCTPGSTFDTGTAEPQVAVTAFPGPVPTSGGYVSPGTTVSLSASPTAAPFWSYRSGTTKNVDRTGDTGLNYNTRTHAYDILGTAGLPIYFACTVTYDAGTGTVTVTPRS